MRYGNGTLIIKNSGACHAVRNFFHAGKAAIAIPLIITYKPGSGDV
jgi:hypothetical protein